jgi:hypothetical protein
VVLVEDSPKALDKLSPVQLEEIITAKCQEQEIEEPQSFTTPDKETMHQSS